MKAAKKNITERYDYVDVAKGIGIILVVLGHCLAYAGYFQSKLYCAIYSFHMPFFFFCSGYLHKQKEIKEYIFGKFKTIFIPMICYLFFNILIYFAAFILGKPKYGMYFRFGAFWFLRTLFVVSIAYAIFDNLSSKYITQRRFQDLFLLGLAICFLLVGFPYADSIEDNANQPIATSLIAFFFYVCGVFTNRYIMPTLKRRGVKRVSLFLLSILYFSVMYLYAIRNTSSVDMNTSRYGIKVYFLVSALAGSFGLMALSAAIKKCRVLQFYGQNSFTILMVHIPVWNASSRMCDFLGIKSEVKIIICFAAAMTISTIAIPFINRFMPILTGKMDLEG